MFESPHRLQAAVKDLVQVCGPARQLTIARELTKRFEQVTTLAVGETADWLARDAHRSQGEFVLIVHRSEEHTSELQSLMRISYAVSGLTKKIHSIHLIS